MCRVAAEEESAGACCARIRTEEVGPELAGIGSEKGNGVAEKGDSVRNRWRRDSICGLRGGRGVDGETSTVSADRVEVYGGQETDEDKAWRGYE